MKSFLKGVANDVMKVLLAVIFVTAMGFMFGIGFTAGFYNALRLL